MIYALYALFTLLIVGWLYLNLVASLITVLQPSLRPQIKLGRLLMIWLIPLLGAAMLLRFSFQAEPSTRHQRLLPKFIRTWLFDETDPRVHSLRDDNDLKGVFGNSSYGHGSRHN